jgi:hypothetical protein
LLFIERESEIDLSTINARANACFAVSRSSRFNASATVIGPATCAAGPSFSCTLSRSLRLTDSEDAPDMGSSAMEDQAFRASGDKATRHSPTTAHERFGAFLFTIYESLFTASTDRI